MYNFPATLGKSRDFLKNLPVYIPPIFGGYFCVYFVYMCITPKIDSLKKLNIYS